MRTYHPVKIGDRWIIMYRDEYETEMYEADIVCGDREIANQVCVALNRK